MGMPPKQKLGLITGGFGLV